MKYDNENLLKFIDGEVIGNEIRRLHAVMYF